MQRNSCSANYGHTANPLAAQPQECGIGLQKSLICSSRLCLGSLMENTLRESATDIAGTSDSPRSRRNNSGFRAGWAVLACSAALALSSCSAGQAESADGGSADGGGSSSTDSSSPSKSSTAPASTTPASTTPASPIPSPTDMKVEFLELAEPVPPTAKTNISAAGRPVLSQQETGGGTYAIEGQLEPGESLNMAASCRPGDMITMTVNHPMGAATMPCDNPGTSWLSTAAADRIVGDVTVTVKTVSGGPFWIAAWATDRSTVAP